MGSMLYSRRLHSARLGSVISDVLRPFRHPAGATPAMRQYFDAKRQYRDAILFFRMGDFYEMFYEDALTAARALELTLTSRSKDANGGAIPDVRCATPRRRQLHRAGSCARASASPSANRWRTRARRRVSSSAKSCGLSPPAP